MVDESRREMARQKRRRTFNLRRKSLHESGAVFLFDSEMMRANDHWRGCMIEESVVFDLISLFLFFLLVRSSQFFSRLLCACHGLITCIIKGFLLFQKTSSRLDSLTSADVIEEERRALPSSYFIHPSRHVSDLITNLSEWHVRMYAHHMQVTCT